MPDDNETPDWMQSESNPDDVDGGEDWFTWADLGPEDAVEGTLISEPIPGPGHPAATGDGPVPEDGHPDTVSDYSRVEFTATVDGEPVIFPVSSEFLSSQIKELWAKFQPPVDFRIEVDAYDTQEDRPRSYILKVVHGGELITADGVDD